MFTDFNADKRKGSNDEFNKNLYKLLNNCIYGKSIENIRKRINVKLVNDKKKYQKTVNKSNSVSQKIIEKKLCSCSLFKESINFKQTNLCWFLYFRIVKIIYVQVSL